LGAISVIGHLYTIVIARRVTKGVYSAQWGYGLIGLLVAFPAAATVIAAALYSPATFQRFRYNPDVKHTPHCTYLLPSSTHNGWIDCIILML
jgi:hypothetical protein